jgi:DNA-binding NarL/FixJ family response regulator
VTGECGPRPSTVLLIGSWSAYEHNGCAAEFGFHIHRCAAELGESLGQIGSIQPAVILFGEEVGDELARQVMLAGCRTAQATVMLGQPGDDRRCGRWTRQGCAAYLSVNSDVPRVLRILRCVVDDNVIVVDRETYLQPAAARYPGPVPSITPRESEVLRLVAEGRKNSEIATALHVTVNTVEFHLHRLFAKVSARNRVEMVDHAIRLGLIY